MAQFKQWFTQDFTEKIEIQHCESVMFTGDDKGAIVGVRLFDSGEAYSGGGTVSGAVKRSDGGLVALTGTLSGNAASVVIPATALAVPGPIGVHIVLTQGGSTTTVLKAIYDVDDNNGAAVDPGTIIPSINDLITAINTAVASIPSDYSALLHTLAPDFSASTAYSAGDYVWYNGTLYRFTSNHAAGSWTGTDATATVVGNDLRATRNELNYTTDALDTTDYVFSLGVTQGVLNNDGTVGSSTVWVTTDYIPVESGVSYAFMRAPDFSGTYTVRLCAYDSNKQFISYVSYTASGHIMQYTARPINIAFIRVSVSAATYNNTFSVRKLVSKVESNETQISEIFGAAEQLSEIVNCIDYYGYCVGRVLADGSISSSSDFLTTQYIPVSDDHYYKIILSSGATFSIHVAWFNAEKAAVNFLENYSATDGEAILIPPVEAVYFRVSFSVSVYNAGVKLIRCPGWDSSVNERLQSVENAVGTTDLMAGSPIIFGKKLVSGGTLAIDDTWVTVGPFAVTPNVSYAMVHDGYTNTYSVRRCVYDANGDYIAYVTYNSQSPKRGYIPPYNVHFVRYSIPIATYLQGVKFTLTDNYIAKPLNTYTEKSDIYSYTGEDVDVDAHKKYICTPMFADLDRAIPSGKTAQAFAIYGNVIFQFLADNACRLYDYGSQAIIGDIAVTCGHVNSAVFSQTFQENGDEFPLAYLSDVTGDVYVNRITRDGGTLVRTLYFDPQTFGNAPQLALDPDNNLCYIVGSQTDTVVVNNPVYIFTTCDLSDLTQTGDKYTPRIISSFQCTIPGNSVVLQGVKYLNGCLWLSSGGASTRVLSRITIVNIQSQAAASALTNFPTNASIHELEDVEFVKDSVTSKYDVILHVREYGYYKLVF